MKNIEDTIKYLNILLSKMPPGNDNRKYILTALSAVERMKGFAPEPLGKYGFACPRCTNDLGVEREDIFLYEITPPCKCPICGQTLDWSKIK